MTTDSKLKPQWFQILLAVSDGRRHGSGIRDEVLRQTEGRLKLWPTSLYGSLKQLSALGYLEEAQLEGAEGAGDRRRFYGITEEGRAAVAGELLRLQKTIAIAATKHVAARES